jgi:hypothetical protein
MKKLLFGCLGMAVLAAILFAVGGFLLYRAGKPVFESPRNYVSGLTELGKLDDRIVNKAPYSAPATGELTVAQMERFARVQDHVRQALGQRMTEIDQKYKSLKPNADNKQPPPIGEIFSALNDLANVFVQARAFQVDALNQEKFSQAEYSWVRDRVFQAAGKEVTSRIDLKKIEDAVKQNTGVEKIPAPELPTINVPEKNREIVKPYLDRMDSWIPLAFFGL